MTRRVVRTARKTGPMKAARKTRTASPPVVRAARKLNISSGSSSSSSSSDADDGPKILPITKKARKRESTPPSEHEVIVISDSDEDIDELRSAFNALTRSQALQQRYHRLPFLLRNLRRGFENRCRQAGVRRYPQDAPNGTVKVVYKYYLDGDAAPARRDSDSSDEEREQQTWEGHMSDWRCPICELHKPFTTREMLMFHLSRDHAEVKVSWTRTFRQVSIPSLSVH